MKGLSKADPGRDFVRHFTQPLRHIRARARHAERARRNSNAFSSSTAFPPLVEDLDAEQLFWRADQQKDPPPARVRHQSWDRWLLVEVIPVWQPTWFRFVDDAREFQATLPPIDGLIPHVTANADAVAIELDAGSVRIPGGRWRSVIDPNSGGVIRQVCPITFFACSVFAWTDCFHVRLPDILCDRRLPARLKALAQVLRKTGATWIHAEPNAHHPLPTAVA